ARVPLDVQDPAPAVLTNITALMGIVAATDRGFRRILDEHVGPAVEALWASRPRSSAQAIDDITIGDPPARPALSIIVPIYGRWDFIEYQLALFRGDAEMAHHELIYVIDDPRIYDTVLQYVRNIHPIFEVPLRLLYAHENRGFAGANNFGAVHARGE